MKTYLKAALLLAAMIPLSGCGRDSHESLRKVQIQTIKDAADTLAAAKDDATTEAIKPKLKGLLERWRDTEKRLGALPVPSPEQAAELQRVHGEPMHKAQARLGDEVVRVAQLGSGPGALQETGDLLNSCAREAHEALRKQQVQTAKEAADLLTAIRDKSAADTAKPALKQLGDRWRGLEKCTDVLPKLSADQHADLKRKYDDELNGVKMRFSGEALRVMLIPGGADALKAAGEIKPPR